MYMCFLIVLSIGKRSCYKTFRFLVYHFFTVVFGMVTTNMLILTEALQSVFIDPKLTDESNNKTGPSFGDLDRMEDFWRVSKRGEIFQNFEILFS